MRFMESFNHFTGKWMPLIVLLCLTTGIVFTDTIGRLTFLVPYVFAFMTFTGALNSNFRQIGNVARHPLPLIVTFVAVHAMIPLVALGLGRLFLPAYPYFITGTVLEYVVPSAVSSVMWCAMAGGSVPLTLAIIIIDTFTAPFIVPFTLRVLVGSNVQVNVAGMMRDLLWMIAAPAVLTMLLNQFSNNRIGKKLSPVMAPYGKLALIFIITVNSTRIAPFVRHLTSVQFGVAGIILGIAVFGYLLGWVLACLLHQGTDVTASMSFACGMRNISAGAVIASAYFPASVMFPVMMGTLFQQALASVFSRLFARAEKAR